MNTNNSLNLIYTLMLLRTARITNCSREKNAAPRTGIRRKISASDSFNLVLLLGSLDDNRMMNKLSVEVKLCSEKLKSLCRKDECGSTKNRRRNCITTSSFASSKMFSCCLSSDYVASWNREMESSNAMADLRKEANSVIVRASFGAENLLLNSGNFHEVNFDFFIIETSSSFSSHARLCLIVYVNGKPRCDFYF